MQQQTIPKCKRFIQLYQGVYKDLNVKEEPYED